MACLELERNTYKVSVEESEGKSTNGRSIGRWQENIKTDLKDIRIDWKGVDWFLLS